MNKILSLQELSERAADFHRMEKRLVLTNGCFDLLHVGHVRYLQQARELGDVLVVALNGDESVRQLKGPGRPINGATDRAEVLAALESVDLITIFPDLRVTKIIENVRPTVYVKGGDYTADSLDPEERSALERLGAKIIILPLVPGKSSSGLIAQMQGKRS
ncbi:MAG: adenylyltransferase/cytidyltransferase family protein [Spartobacteria bacterium]